jgi:nitrogen regulatory protein P-II 1
MVMKEINAFVRPDRLADIVEHLREEGFCCMTVFKGEGTGHFSYKSKEWPSLDHPFLHSKVAKIEIVTTPGIMEKAIRIIHERGKIGDPGDGLIYLTDVSKAVRVKDLSVDTQQFNE